RHDAAVVADCLVGVSSITRRCCGLLKGLNALGRGRRHERQGQREERGGTAGATREHRKLSHFGCPLSQCAADLVLFKAMTRRFPYPSVSRRRFLQGAVPVALSLRGLPALAAKSLAPPAFEQILPARSGIHWVHTAGKSAAKHLPETSGPGCAFLDYDNDGWMDIYLVNSGKADFYTPATPLRNALYRNNRDGTFTDVTEKAGVAGGGYGMGVAVGDYNNDGLPDLYVTQVGRNILYRNNGDGTFTDVTAKAGVACEGWSTSAVWFDYDNDGRLDLFVCQFVEFDKSTSCGLDARGRHHYCIPKIFKPRPSWLFHNNGDGTFTDVSEEAGIREHLGKAWSAVAADLDNDGRMD